MAKIDFPTQIDYLLFSGDIEGEELLSLHSLLQSYQQGLITDEEMQEAINGFNTDLFLMEPPIDELSME